MTNIKITALTDIGNNIAPTTLVPVVDMAGTPTTKKSNLQNVGNLILNGAGVSGFVPAARAVLSQSVTNAAQPNITSLGTLTSLSVAGNVSLGAVSNVNIGGGFPGQLLATDGNGALSWVNDPSGSYNNSNVANYLPTFTGTVGANRISSNALSGSNVEISANGAVFTFGQGGALYWPAPGGNIWVIEPNVDNEFEIRSTSNVVISTDVSNANLHFTFASDGVVYCPANANFEGTRLNVGPGAANVPLATNPTLVVTDSGIEFIQAALINQSSNGSSDYAAYGANSDETQGFADLGFAGHTFNDPNYTITNPGDGYVLSQGYANGIGGSLVLATGQYGNVLDIVFATGGYLTNNEFARIDHANSLFHLTRGGSGIKFADGTIQTTASTSGGLPLANGNSNFNIATSNGNATITANGTYTWTFDDSGKLSAPGNAAFNGNVITLGTGAANLAAGLNNPTIVISDSGDAFIQAAINNVSDIGSADWVAYGHHGNDAGGWTDMGFASSFFNDPNYTITVPGDGYVFVQGYPVGQAPAVGGGSLVLATGTEGLTKDIIFATGGFLANNEFARIDHANNMFHLTRANSGIKFNDGSIQTTAVTPSGSNGEIQFNISGAFASTGNLTFVDGISGGTLEIGPPGAMQLDGNGTVVASNLSSAGNVYVSAGNGVVDLRATSNIVLKSDNANYQWTFDNAGTFQSPVTDYANLPAATTAGIRAFINDANLVAAGNFGVTVGSGGSNTVPVYSDGSNWRIG